MKSGKVVIKDIIKKAKVEVKMKPREPYHNVFFKEGRKDER